MQQQDLALYLHCKCVGRLDNMVYAKKYETFVRGGIMSSKTFKPCDNIEYHDDDLATEQNHWIVSTPHVEYFKQTFVFNNRILCPEPIMMYMSYPGFITIEPITHAEQNHSDEELYNQGLHYFNTEYDLVRSQAIRAQNERLRCDKKLKKIDKETRRMQKTWRLIVNANGEDSFITSQNGYELIVREVDLIVNVNNKSDVYYPVCLKHQGNITGGMFASVWEAIGEIKPDIKNQRFDAFVTGSCLFGNEVFGVDDNGMRHPLTNPRHDSSTISIIQKIEYLHDRHCDEIVTLESFKNLSVFFSCLIKK